MWNRIDSARRRSYWSDRVSVNLIPMAASSFVRYLDRGRMVEKKMEYIMKRKRGEMRR